MPQLPANFIKHFTMGSAATAIPCLLLVYYVLDKTPLNNDDLLSLAVAMKHVEAEHISHPSSEELTEYMLEGLANGLNQHQLDPWASYRNKHSHQHLNETLHAHYGGFGFLYFIDTDAQNIRVRYPRPDTPAARAGMLPGDIITEIDGKAATEFASLRDAINSLDNKNGPVQMHVNQPRQATRLIEMSRDTNLTEHPVKPLFGDTGQTPWLIVQEPNIAYLHLTLFNVNTADEVANAINELVHTPLDGLIIDLRENPGGMFDESIDLGGLFLGPEKPIAHLYYADGVQETFTSQNQAIVPDSLPIVLLVNQHSASSSEIFAAAMQDHHRAVIMGSQTLGKGHMQYVSPLPEPYGSITYSVATFHSPQGRPLAREPDSTEWGVMPLAAHACPETELQTHERLQFNARYILTEHPLYAQLPVDDIALFKKMPDPQLLHAITYLTTPRD